tara:strand:+ start:8917 stop:9399 length:483 start_codon:yes stop_codon:yes gene_type:complete
VLLKLRPAGRDGEIDQFVTAPPPEVGSTVDMVVPLINVSELGEYVTADGAISLTTMVTLAVSVPPVLVAVIVYDAEEVIAVGVPEIAPVEVSNDKPAGSDGDTEYEVTVPPVEVTVAVVIAVPFVNVSELGLYAMEGAISLTTMVTVAVSLPPVLLAVMV